MTASRLATRFIRPIRWRCVAAIAVLLALLVALHLVYNYKEDSFGMIRRAIKRLSRSTTPERKLPQHVLLLSYARSGSSFVGDLLQSLLGGFYHFEPMHFFGNSVLNDSFDEVRTMLRNIFHCNVSQVKGFLKWQQKHVEYMKLKRDWHYWKTCSKQKACYNETFIDSFCHNHTSVIVKSIRLGLPAVLPLFDSVWQLNLKVIYLTRDPRGVFNSRMKSPVVVWCKKDPTCSDIQHFCSSMKKDLEVAQYLLAKFPNLFMVVRYEDLALRPLAMTRSLARFLGLPSVPHDTEAFLRTHTFVVGKPGLGGLAYSYTTFRNSSEMVHKWRSDFPYQKVKELQEHCSTVLDRLGYYVYTTVGALRSNVNFDRELHSSLTSIYY